MRDDHLHGFEEIFTDEVGLVFPQTALVLPLAQSVTTQHERRTQSRISRELNITVTIAHHPTRTPIDVKLLRRPIDQPRLRPATIPNNPPPRPHHPPTTRA